MKLGKGGVLTMTSSGAPESLYLCARRQSVRYRGKLEKLPDLSFKLLLLLAEQAPSPVTFEQIEREVWAARVTRETIKQRAKLLRDALVALGAPEDAVASARSVGYRLTLPCVVEDPAGPIRDGRSARLGAVAVGVGALLSLALFLSFVGVPSWRADEAWRLAVASEATNSTDAAVLSEVARALSDRLAGQRGVRVLAEQPSGARQADLLVSARLRRSTAGPTLSLQLVERRAGVILWAEQYPFDASDYDRALVHFSQHVHAHVQAMNLELGAGAYRRQPRAAREEYLTLVQLTRGADQHELLNALARLDRLIADRPDFGLARSLRVRIVADLAIRHGDSQRVGAALAEARDLVATHPEAADFRYAPARTHLANGNRPALCGNCGGSGAAPFLGAIFGRWRELDAE
ncbi:MAG: winged helix-turn-helix domain-containing protein [Hyphomonadaceae bacterium]